MRHLGNYEANAVIDFKFTTTDGVQPATLSGGVLSVYKADNTTANTASIALTANFDSITGLNHVQIDLSNAFYDTDENYDVVITTGSVGGESVIGYAIASFTVEKGVVNAKLTADGLDNIPITPPTGVATTFREMMIQVWWRMFKRVTLVSGFVTMFRADNSTVMTSQQVSDNGTTQTQGPAT